MGRPGPNQYRRLNGRRFWAGTDGAWLHASHLLLVKTRWLREQYMRLYWHDIQAIVLYGVRSLGPIGGVLEAACLLACAGYAFVFGTRVVMACAVVFLLLYGFARYKMKRFGYAVYTRVNVAYVPASASRAASAAGLAALEAAVRNAQGGAALEGAAAQRVGPATMGKTEPRTLAHTFLFIAVIAISCARLFLNDLRRPAAVIGMGTAVFAVLLPLLFITLVLQRDFEFPASVRIFAWFYQIGFPVELVQSLSTIWIPHKRPHGGIDAAAYALTAFLPALCGLSMIYLERLKKQDPIQYAPPSLQLR